MGYLGRQFEVRGERPITGLYLEPFCGLAQPEDNTFHVRGGEFFARDPRCYDPSKGDKGGYFGYLESHKPERLFAINLSVLEAAWPHVAGAHRSGDRGPLLFSVNMAPSDFLNPQLGPLMDALRRNLPPHQIGLEITEPRRSYSESNVATIYQSVATLSRLGFRLGLDDVPEDWSEDFRVRLSPYMMFMKFDPIVSQRTLEQGGNNLSPQTKALVSYMKRHGYPVVFEGVTTPKDISNLMPMTGRSTLAQSWHIDQAERRLGPRGPRAANNSRFGKLEGMRALTAGF